MDGDTPPAVIDFGTMAEEFKYSRVLICPVCSYEHYDHPKDEYTGAAEPRHRCSHNAYLLFAKGDCPVCQEDQTGPPTVGLSCGHVICPTDFQRLGGRVGTVETNKGGDERHNRNHVATAAVLAATSSPTSDTTNRNGQRASETRRQRESLSWPNMSGDIGTPGSLRSLVAMDTLFSAGHLNNRSISRDDLGRTPYDIAAATMTATGYLGTHPLLAHHFEGSESANEDDFELSGSLPELIGNTRRLSSTGLSGHSARTIRNSQRTRQASRRERRRNSRRTHAATASSNAADILQPTGRMPTMRPSPALSTNTRTIGEIPPLDVRGGGGGQGSNDRIDSDSDSMPELAGGRGDADNNSSSDNGSVPQLVVGPEDNDSSTGSEDEGSSVRDDDSSSSAPPPLSARRRRNGTNGANEMNASNSSNEAGDGGDDSDDSDDESDVPSLISRPSDNEISSSESDSDGEEPVRRPSRGNEGSFDDDSAASGLSDVHNNAVDGMPTLVPRTSDIPSSSDEERSTSNGEAGTRTGKKRQEREVKRKSDAATVLSSRFRRYISQKRYRRSCQSTLKIQTWGRRLLAQRKWSALVKERVAASRRFAEIWTPVLESARSAATAANKEKSWEAIKAERFDMLRTLIDQAPTAETTAATDRLDSAVQTALELSDRELDTDGGVKHYEAEAPKDSAAEPTSDVAAKVGDNGSYALQVAARPKCDHIQLTKDVLRWLDRQDARYRGFFVRRILQLANGDRSRILKKNLTGTHSTTIWETYLEQKSGQRILWTEYKYTDGEGQNEVDVSVACTKNKQYSNNHDHRRGLLIWYVAKHDNGTYLLELSPSAPKCGNIVL